MATERFGRYETLCQIGDGAMGRVYRAWDPRLSRVVAVKAVKSEYLTHHTAPDYLRRFRREAQAAGSLSHPSIVRIFDVGFDFLVMEHVEGPTLKDLIAGRGPLAPRTVVQLLSPIADAVDAAHRAGVVHRDIKPANIMVQGDGTPKLMDFGIAHIDNSVLTTAGEILGSPSYMSPEQIAGFDVTGASDVYALAVVAYELLIGQPPFVGTLTQVIYKVMHEDVPPPRQWNSTLPPRYDEVFARALAKDAARRFPTAAELVSALAEDGLEDELAAMVAVPPASSSSDRGFYAHLETIMSRPGGQLLRRGRPASRRSAVAALALVSLAAGSSALLARGPDAATAAAVRTSDASLAAAATTGLALQQAAPSKPAPVDPQPASAPGAAPAGASSSVVRTAEQPSARPVHAAAHTALRPAARAATPLATPPATQPALPAAPRLLEPVSYDPVRFAEAGLTPPRKLAGGTVFPRRTAAGRLNGTVTVSLVVDEDGVPRDLAVVGSAGAVLDAAALETVRSWRFAPARRDGVPVRVRWLARQTYQLSR